MKKTLIALAALSGVAFADTLTWYQDLTTTLPTETTLIDEHIDAAKLTVSEWTGTYSDNGADPVAVTLADNNNNAYSKGQLVVVNPDVLEAYRNTDKVTYSFTLTNSSDVSITLNSVNVHVYATSNGGNYQGGARSGNVILTMGDTTTGPQKFTVDSNTVLDLGVDFADVTLAAGESKAVSLAFTGDKDSARWFLGLGDVTWHGAPEPATATLSLLALAGLASRRRRH